MNRTNGKLFGSSSRRPETMQVHMPQMINPADIKKEQDRGYSSFIPGPFLHSDDDDNESSISHSTDGSSKRKKSIRQLVKKEDKSSKKLKTNGKSAKRQKTSLTSSDPLEQKSSIEEGKETFAWIINPVPIEDFFNATWEMRPLHICRDNSSYYTALMSTAKFDTMLREHNIQFTKNLDITSYKNGKRETHNPEGRATAAQVWEAYKSGCSIRLLNPQTFNQHVFALNAILQEYFGCMVGANMYLTPPGTQGFAPHYDDIEAFVIQLEGRKHWRLYTPRNSGEELPRFSSGNLNDEEIGKSIMDVVLEAGDLLYFPRGTIHQANALPDTHSLHITISSYQKNSWGDFLLKLLPAALETALEEDVEFRRGLPLDYLQYVGVAHCEYESSKRTEFIAKLKTLTDKIIGFAPIDAAADQMAKTLMHDALPPNLKPEEIERTCIANSTRMDKGELIPVTPLTLDTKIKFVRANVIRLVSEEDTVRLYHSLENSTEYHAEDSKFLEVTPEEAGGIETLLHEYPKFIPIDDLPLDTDAEKLQIANILWKKGLVMTEVPLQELK